MGIKQVNTSEYHPQDNGTIKRYHKTMNQGSSHYVNASFTNWDTLAPFYLMAYRATPRGTSGYSPYCLLHSREMILPTSQDLRAKLSPDVRESECANRLENLKSTLKTAYKSVRENNYKSHVTNKRYLDRRAKERIFKAGDIVYLFSTAKKPGQSSKFWKPWTGPFKVVAGVSSLRVKESVVHVNRLKRAYKQGIWKERGQEKCYRKQCIRRQESEADESAILAPGPTSIPAPQDDRRQPSPGTPNRNLPRQMDPLDGRDWIRTTFHRTHPVPDTN